ncbi:MAG: tRNA (guanosine(37)-N1)-methyltransferase TrmD [Hyphomicrobiaceae bacterium]|nr:tRNA (guanosine(37)-N1)-methyltransferase TrmD [Hyphomicrobiaceae bacterium]
MSTKCNLDKKSAWHAHVVTLFPNMFPGPLSYSVVGKALSAGRWTLSTTNIRDFGLGSHRTVDGTPSGGGPGMVMRCDVLASAIDHARKTESGLQGIYLSPRGEKLTPQLVKDLILSPGLLLVAGRFEGIDQRIIERRKLREISIGDYVLSGGELAAMVLIDACVRRITGVLGSDMSLDQESFEGKLLEYPHYTQPREWESLKIPEILLSGNHSKISAWRLRQSEKLTRARRPDLLGPITCKHTTPSDDIDNI